MKPQYCKIVPSSGPGGHKIMIVPFELSKVCQKEINGNILSFKSTFQSPHLYIILRFNFWRYFGFSQSKTTTIIKLRDVF